MNRHLHYYLFFDDNEFDRRKVMMILELPKMNQVEFEKFELNHILSHLVYILRWQEDLLQYKKNTKHINTKFKQ